MRFPTAIIGVSGQAGVGKDTFAEYLRDHHHFIRIALADPMKRIAKAIYDFSDEQLWGPSAMRNAEDKRYPRDPEIINFKYPQGHLSPRVALQVLGTEFGRTCYLNTWVDMALRDAKKLLSGKYFYTPQDGVFASKGVYPAYSGVVIPDVRFRNEIDAIKAAGGKVIRLRRQTSTDPLKVGAQNHASELEQQSIPDSVFNHVVEAEEGLQHFFYQLDHIVPDILESP